MKENMLSSRTWEIKVTTGLNAQQSNKGKIFFFFFLELMITTKEILVANNKYFLLTK